MSIAIVWFRRDLRLADNAALRSALESGAAVVPVYIHAPDEEGAGAPGGASRWWLHHSLASLDASLRARGSRLLILRGPTLPALQQLVRTTGAGAVYWNRAYEPALIARDATIKAALRADGIDAHSSNASLLFEPWEVQTGSGTPYRVFTPYWRLCQTRLSGIPAPAAAPQRLPCPARQPSGIALDALELLPTRPWGAGLARSWQVGEAAAARSLAAFVDGPVGRYASARDLPAEPGTSRLSPHLHFGELSPRQALAAAQSAAIRRRATGIASGCETFIKELGWREFAHHLLYHYPQTVDQPLDTRFAQLPWQTDPAGLAAWQRGRTGIPIVDAGMRELYATGWMHNRVRMIVASLLCKNLGIHWREGAAWFHDTLVDADLAANTFGWQWSAGCGADAAPYYRIFNPVLQAERYDPGRGYLRRWLPELARLPDAWVHRPDAAPDSVLTAAGVTLGRTYPRPVVDLKATRDRALAGYASMRAAPVVNLPATPPRKVSGRRRS